MIGLRIELGFDYRFGTDVPVSCDFHETGHMALVGGTGSGKSMTVLYYLYKLFFATHATPFPLDLFVADFKRSGDYHGLSDNYAEFEQTTDLIRRFYELYSMLPDNDPTIHLLIIDEYAGYVTWLTQQDKKLCAEIQGIVSSLLMLGRSRHCFVWCIQQRIGASLFPAGAGSIDNFQICVGLGNLSVDSRRSLFAGEHLADDFEAAYHPGRGEGLILIDGQELAPLKIPVLPDKARLTALLRSMAHHEAARRAAARRRGAPEQSGTGAPP